jgi:hypothetical protein
MQKLFGDKKDKTGNKNYHRQSRTVMFVVAVNEGVDTHHKCQGNHAPFEENIVHDVDPE